MQMIAIIGAVVSGIVMWIGNTNYKKGAAWGQPVAIAFGVIAIAMGIWAMTLNGGNAGAVNKEIGYQKVRAEKLGKYIAANFADKKILVLTSLKKGLGSVSCDVLARPVPEGDEAMEEMEWRFKHLANLFEGKDNKGNAISGYSPVGDFDLLITTIGLPEDTFKGGKGQGKLAGKSIAFVQGYTERWGAMFKNKTIVAAVLDKPYPGESDKAGLANWEQNPPSDMEKAFDVRYTLKTN